MLVQFAALVLGSILDVFGEPLVELIMRVEQAGHDEVQQSPEFWSAVRTLAYTKIPVQSRTLHGVLNRGTREE